MTDRDWKKLKMAIVQLESTAGGILRLDDVKIMDEKCRHPYFHVTCSWYEIDELERLWKQLGEIPVSSDDRLEEEFHAIGVMFEKGCKIEDVWHWFDERHPFGVKYLMYGIRDASKEAT